MSTTNRAKISPRNKWWISEERFLELKHYCKQYPEWKKAYNELTLYPSYSSSINRSNSNHDTDVTGDIAAISGILKTRMKLIEDCAKEADPVIGSYILKAVTNGLPFTYLKTVLNIPCEKDMYYDRFRKFYYLLSQKR